MEVSERRLWKEVIDDFFPNPGEMPLLESLPFIANALDCDGVFYWCNKKCLDFFGLQETDCQQYNIQQFYTSPPDRQELMARLKKKPAGTWLMNSLLDLKIHGEHHFLKDYSRMVCDRDGKILGLVSIMINVTQEERYHQLFENLPIGIFRFSELENGLVSANEKFVQMHGFENLEEIRHAPVSRFMADKEQAAALVEEIRKIGRLEKRHIRHRKKDGTTFLGSINVTAIYDDDGKYQGAEGTVVDVTTEGLFSDLINLVPIGLFKIVISDKGQHVVVNCNDAFAQNHGFSTHTEMIGADIRQYHSSPEAFEQYYRLLVENDRKGAEPQPFLIERKNLQGENVEFQTYTRLEKDPSGKITGRVGAQREVTNERKLEKRLREITSDIGQVLHAYSTTLVMAKTNFEAVLEVLSSRKKHFDGEIFLESAVLDQIDQAIRTVRSLAVKFAPAAEEPGQADYEELERLCGLLREVSGQENVNQFTAQNNLASSKIIETLNESAYFVQQKERARQLKQAVDEVIRLSCIIFLNRGLEGILEMEAPVVNLRSYLIDGVKPQEEPASVDLYELFLDIAKGLFSYAASRGIEIKYFLREIQNLYIRGYEVELKRAFTNLLHNAIKYSWTRKVGEAPYVELRVKRDGPWIVATFSNRGVGVSRKELAEGQLFLFGYRGERSSDRRRPGTGIGLHDAKKVIEMHRGSIDFDSRPIYGNPDVDNFNLPYLTTVTCRIPINPFNDAI